MGRLPGFDYKRPFYYMVTVKRATGGGSVKQLPFSKIEQGKIEANAITRAFKEVIEHFHETWYCIEPIWCYVIMPDHLHLLIKIRDIGKRVSLAVLVRQLIKALEKSARSAGEWGLPQPLFAFEWHDWIVKKKGQLDAFIRYIRENAERAWARRINRQYFSQVRRVVFAGREWFAYGNTALLELPVIDPFKCSRKWANGGPEWREAVARAERIGPAGAGAGTFMSPCEKAFGNAIFNAGGAIIMLNPEGFGERWHPTRNKEALCAKGRMLFLSLYEPSAAKPDNATLYKRCHEMGDLILGAERQRQDSETRDLKI
ncbi:MAG: hypothetical protein IJL17_06165 [Kiritimatiellae bacterium]|nr:hypothetical protein [Kiritimatiellia bacterium]